MLLNHLFCHPSILQVLEGNSDSVTPTRQELSPTILARFLRFVPVEYQQSIALRLEVFGCAWSEWRVGRGRWGSGGDIGGAGSYREGVAQSSPTFPGWRPGGGEDGFVGGADVCACASVARASGAKSTCDSHEA